MVVNYYPSRSHLSKDRVDDSTLTLIHLLRMVTGFAGHWCKISSLCTLESIYIYIYKSMYVYIHIY